MIAAAFLTAERGYREALAAVPLTEIVAGVARDAAEDRKQRIGEWIDLHAGRPA